MDNLLAIPAFTHAPEVNHVYNVDALSLLRALPTGSVDMVFIDPPYGNNNGVDDLAGARARDKVRGGRQRGELDVIANDTPESWEALIKAVLPEINRVLKPESACCCMASGGGPSAAAFAEIAMWINQHHTFFHAVVWDKSKRGNGMGWRYRRNYEFIMVSHKRGGKLRWNEERGAQPNVIYFPPTPNELHVTQKPVEMIEWFIRNHTYRGDVVVDCFMGSGTTCVAAKKIGRLYIGCDVLAKNVTIAQRRLSEPQTVDMFAAIEAAS
jgi:site-specific DNA-methyltransferase (adenine-specific)